MNRGFVAILMAVGIWILLSFASVPSLVVPFARVKKFQWFFERLIRVVLIAALLLYPLNLSFVVGEQKIQKPTFNIGILLDVSLSMTAKDISPSRWEVARDALIRLIEKLKGFNVFIVTYSGRAFLRSPITDNLKALKIKLELMRFEDFPPTPGFLWTAIGNAILLGIDTILKFADQNQYPPWVLILITDGDSNTWYDPLQAAKLAKKAWIKIYAIGIGAERMPIGQTVVWGEEIIGVNEELLRQIAQITEWDYTVAKSADELMVFFDKLANQINQWAWQKPIVVPKKFYLNDVLRWVILVTWAIWLVLRLITWVRFYSRSSKVSSP